MAVSTTSTLDDLTNASVLDPVFMGHLLDFRVVDPFLREYDLAGKGSKTVRVANLDSNAGTVDDAGSGYDTEFNASEGVDLTSTTTQSTSVKTIASSEYAVYMTVTDNVAEDSVPGAADAIMREILDNAAELLMLAFEDDVCALFTSLNGGTAVGSSGSDLTLANINTAIVTIRNSGVRLPDGLVGVLAPIQGTDFEAAILATNAAQAIYEGTADAYLSVRRDAVNGLANGFLLAYRGIGFWITGMCDTANTNADRVGAIFGPSTPANNRYCALGKTVSRRFRLETDRDITLRGFEIVGSLRAGTGELQDKAGVPIITDL